MCPEIPFWFVLLATWGAVSGISLIAFALIALLADKFARKDERVSHVGQIRRPIFLRRRYGR